MNWSLTTKVLFRGQNVWEIVQNGFTKSVDNEAYNNLTQDEKDALREQRKKNRNALFYIHQAMHGPILQE